MNRSRSPSALIVVIVLSALPAQPASATHSHPTKTHVVQNAPLPCTVACASWVPDMLSPEAQCHTPGPQGSFDRTVFEITEPTRWITIETYPNIDYDSFLCTDTEPSRLIEPLVPDCCGGLTRGIYHVGCYEEASIHLGDVHRVNGGENDRFVLVSYNWLDNSSLPVQLTGPVRIVDDSFEALPVPPLPPANAEHPIPADAGNDGEDPKRSTNACIIGYAAMPQDPRQRLRARGSDGVDPLPPLG